MTFQLYMTLQITSGSLGIPSYITLIETVWPIVVVWLTWLMTRLDMIVLVCSCCFWCACRAAVLLSDGCPLGVSQLHLHMERCTESSMVIGFAWCCIHMFILTCTLACLTCSSIHENACFSIRSSANTSSRVCPFAHPRTHLRMVIHSQTNLFVCIVCSFVSKHVLLHVLSLFIPSVITSCLFLYMYLQSLMTRWHQIHKPPSLPWCMMIFRCRWLGERKRLQKIHEANFELGCGFLALLMKTAQKSLRDGDVHLQWLSAGYDSARGQIHANFGRSTVSYRRTWHVGSAQFLEWTGSRILAAKTV